LNTAGNTAASDALAARPMLNSGKTLNYQATISGPIYIPKVVDGRNKLFFFLGFSELKNRQSARPSEINYTVPTLAMRASGPGAAGALGADAVSGEHSAASADPEPDA